MEEFCKELCALIDLVNENKDDDNLESQVKSLVLYRDIATGMVENYDDIPKDVKSRTNNSKNKDWYTTYVFSSREHRRLFFMGQVGAMMVGDYSGNSPIGCIKFEGLLTLDEIKVELNKQINNY